MKTKIKNTAVLLLAGVIGIGTLGGCGGQKVSADEAQTHLINVAKTSNSALTNPLIQIGQEQGYFDDYQVELKETTLETSGTFESLSVGKIDTTYGQLIPPLSYGSKGADVTLFAELFPAVCAWWPRQIMPKSFRICRTGRIRKSE